MTEHVHRWRVYFAKISDSSYDTAWCKCGEVMRVFELERRLNATERLSKSKADTAASLIRGHTVKDDLKAYVRELEDE